MNNGLIDTLATLVERYFQELKNGGVECRLVIPALTQAIAINLQISLLERSLPSYLVVPETEQPDQSKRWIRAEAVTSVRQGDMLVVVWPGEMSRIQDSVIGVGGAMRNFSFDDEWPWIDEGNEYFKFEGPILRGLLTQWSIHSDHISAYTTIIEMARLECRDSLMRGPVFLDQMLGRFDPNCPSELGSIQRLLFHFGLPNSTDLDLRDQESARLFFTRVRAVTSEVEYRLKEVGGKDELLTRIDEVESDPTEAKLLRSSLEAIIDLFTKRGDNKQQGTLALRGCWKDLDAWKIWNLESLEKILNVSPRHEKVDVTLELSIDAGVVSEDAKTIVILDGGIIKMRIKYAGLISDIPATKVVVRNRSRTPLFEHNCVTASGICEATVSFDQIFEYAGSNKKKILRVNVERSDRVLASTRTNIVPCGPNQPLVALIEPIGKVIVGEYAPQYSEPGDSTECVEIGEPATMTVISWDSFEDGEVEIDDEAEQLEPHASNRQIFTLPKVIDPTSNGAARTSVSVRASGLSIDFDVESKEISRGEFTIERELIMQLGRGQRDAKISSLKRILDLFGGKASQGYPGLGGIDERSMSRRRFAQIFERVTYDGRPIITNLLRHDMPTQPPIETETCIAELENLPPILNDSKIHQNLRERLNSYAADRSLILDKIKSRIDNSSKWPDYAYIPIFFQSDQDELEPLLAAYLNSYISCLNFAKENVATLSWPELLRTIYSDCVVHWDDSLDSRKIVLLGPWHPVTVAKRFMVQSSLVKYALRHVRGTDNSKLPRLALLLDQVNALRWFAGLADDGKTSTCQRQLILDGWQLFLIR